MSARFLEAICSFDQVVPEIGKKKSPCPIMVSDQTSDHPEELSEPLMSVTCDEAQSARVSVGCELC